MTCALNAVTGRNTWASDPSGLTGDVSDSIQSSAAVAGGLFYVGRRNGELYALHASTGKDDWTFTLDIGHVIGSAAPSVANGVIYTDDVGGSAEALNSATGRPMWVWPAGYPPQTSPAIANRTCS